MNPSKRQNERLTPLLKSVMEKGPRLCLYRCAGLGLPFVKAVKGPYSYIPVIPTGGVTLDNVSVFIEVGSDAVGLGGTLVRQDAIEQENYSLIRETAVKFVGEIRKARLQYKTEE